MDLRPHDLGEALGDDLARSIDAGRRAGAAFEASGSTEEIFAVATARAIRAIEQRDRANLICRFLTRGPYCDAGEIPRDVQDEFLSDDEVASAIRSIHSSAISSFQGMLAELLAIRPIARLVSDRCGDASAARVYLGDTALARRQRGEQWAKSADIHLLRVHDGWCDVVGVGEVKSYALPRGRLDAQLAQHIARAARGLRVQSTIMLPERVRVMGGRNQPLLVSVVPAGWQLPRDFHYDKTSDGRSFLIVEPPRPQEADDRIEDLGGNRWSITLRWSEEALAAAAYTMTFRYMRDLGQRLFADGVPPEWEGMSREEAGANAAKMMLYYAILRARTVREESRAIALYNSYGFGYALGTNFVDRHRRREMLWFEDLDEILVHGISRRDPRMRDGKPERAQRCRLRGYGHGAT